MAYHKIRTDKTCLNCGAEVNDRFCPHCGQENIETRHPFHYLFSHFLEDVTHYDSNFWKTLKYLLFRPGKLTIEYLAGKRMSYVQPVRLFVFISFITFFLMAIFSTKPHINIGNHSSTKDSLDNIAAIHTLNSIANDSITFSKSQRESFPKEAAAIRDGKGNSNTEVIGFGAYHNVKTVEELDSLQKTLPKNKKPSWIKYFLKRKYMYLQEEGYSNNQIFEKFRETIFHNIPKAIFFYLPFFAFWLWLFHNKKKWYYFDHGIFSLHYFSFLLSVTTILYLLTIILDKFENHVTEIIILLLYLFGLGYMFFYFFRSHSRIYKEPKAISRLKGFALFFINLFFMLTFLIAFMLITIYNLD
ncbi:MAG: DUF3667 domain-containing protein [Arachidicoccus sp.]|nr:DUF3667 domain-containing protein [Arachidicoccus sp.]